MAISKQQLFNDGVCMICRFKTSSELRITHSCLRFENRTVGSERFYKAAEMQHRVDKVIRVPFIFEPRANDVVIIDDEQYNILQVQYIRDTKPKAWQLSIELRKKRLEINVNES